MEYILEELLRQRKALAALMNGGAPEKQDSSGEEGPARREPETEASDSWQWTDGTTGGYRGAVSRSSGETAAAETLWNAYMVTGGAESRYLSTALRNGGEMAISGAAQEILEEDGRVAFRREVGAAENGGVFAGKAAAERASRRLGRFRPGEQAFIGNAKLSGGAEAVEMVSVRAVTAWDGGTAETDARALSRAVQRDARRYDGGFMAR